MSGLQARKLLVEGVADRRVIVELLRASGIQFPAQVNEAPISIEPFDGLPNLTQTVFETELKAAGLESFGLVVDANDNPGGRWQRLRSLCLAAAPDFPEQPVESGLVVPTVGGIRLGAWLMPDNSSRGMLETFLSSLIDPADELWPYSRSVCDEARLRGAPFAPSHADKAAAHTWLAWQEPPGRQLHVAVMKRLFDPSSTLAASFVGWLTRLFAL